jgi:hypothetical protein
MMIAADDDHRAAARRRLEPAGGAGAAREIGGLPVAALRRHRVRRRGRVKMSTRQRRRAGRAGRLQQPRRGAFGRAPAPPAAAPVSRRGQPRVVGERPGVRPLKGADSNELARRTEQQAANLEETAAALTEISATVNKSAEGANHAHDMVFAADEDAKKSAVVVREAVKAMDEIAQSSQQIGQIIGVIDEIAFQTNLLALNAGVEAARAGDAGRGFAVVASEVRALAQRSAEAAKEIKGLISKSAAQVDRGVKLVAETGDSLGRIMQQVAEINTRSSPTSPVARRSSRRRSPKSASRSPISTRRPSRTPRWPRRRRRRAARFRRKPNGWRNWSASSTSPIPMTNPPRAARREGTNRPRRDERSILRADPRRTDS